MDKEIQAFLNKMKDEFTTAPSVVKREGSTFVVKWLWDKNNKPIKDETKAAKGVIHEYSSSGRLKLEAMI